MSVPPAQIGFGASGPWAMPWFAEDRAYDVLAAAASAGMTDFDTGPSYAGGNAEPRLGRLLAKLEEEGRVSGPFGLSSKVGTRLGERRRLVKDFGPDQIDRQLAASLAALRRPALDVLYLHGPDERQLRSALPTLIRHRDQGAVSAIGVTCDGDHVRHATSVPEVDWIMAPYNALRQRNGVGLRAAKEAGKRVAVVAPLAQGLWRRDLLLPRSRAGVWYAARALARNRAELAAARRARWLREVPDWSPAALSIAFLRVALAPDLILTTTTNPGHVAETADASRRAVPDALAVRLQGLIVS